MKPASTALINYLNAARAAPDVQMLMADAYLFAFANGNVLGYTNIDVPFTFNGQLYVANSVRIDGLKYKAAIGLEVDSQDITIAALSTDTITGGAAVLQALARGAYDGCAITRYRVFFSDRLGGTIVGGVLLFKGRLGTIDQLGRTTAKLKVNSDLILLDNYMPRNVYQPTCLHALYDAGCALAKSSFGFAGTVGAGSTISQIVWAGANPNFVEGTITFNSGANAGVTAQIGSVTQGASLNLVYPLVSPSAQGDSFTAYFGCDHTEATCIAKFNNLKNFRAFPFVPPPQMAV